MRRRSSRLGLPPDGRRRPQAGRQARLPPPVHARDRAAQHERERARRKREPDTHERDEAHVPCHWTARARAL
ncbi:MAG: hypothetical protein DMD85_11090 [Candidatus Rokuibacteriota bacterium]|nr:MAG: hypothetical protein DMD85_11090 [Candidatus Rokubacteria bacterium]